MTDGPSLTPDQSPKSEDTNTVDNKKPTKPGPLKRIKNAVSFGKSLYRIFKSGDVDSVMDMLTGEAPEPITPRTSEERERIMQTPAKTVPQLVRHVRESDGVPGEYAEEDLHNHDARELLAFSTEFDFTQFPDAQRMVTSVEQATKTYLVEKLTALHLPADYIENLVLYYLTSSPLTAAGGAGGIDLGTGLAYIATRRSQFDVRFLTTIMHELSHASTKILRTSHHWQNFRNGQTIYDPVWQERNMGFDRQIVPWDRGEEIQERGSLLENAAATMDAAFIYGRIAHPLIGDIATLREKSIGEITPDYVRSAIGEEKRFSERALAAKRLGVPLELIASHAGEAQPLDQLIAYWKIARILGSKLPDLDPTRANDSQYLFNRGRNFLETSRYTGTDDAFNVIIGIFGDDNGNLIINADQHPDNLDDILTILKTQEQAMKLPGLDVQSPEEFQLY